MPLGWRVAATVPGTPGPAVGVVPGGTVRAGQIVEQPVVQLLIPPWSEENVYRAKPWASTRTVPKLALVAASTVAPEAAPTDDGQASATTTTPGTNRAASLEPTAASRGPLRRSLAARVVPRPSCMTAPVSPSEVSPGEYGGARPFVHGMPGATIGYFHHMATVAPARRARGAGGGEPGGGGEPRADNEPPSASSADPRPLGGYAVLLTVYAVVVGTLVYVLRGRRGRVEAIGVKQLLVMGLATQHLSRLVSKDSVLAPVRAPFTRFVGPAGEGESNEEATGHGLRHAVGEMLSCPFCIAQWVATAFVAGSIAAPSATQAGMSVLAAAQVSDYLQLAYGALRKLD